MCRLGDGLVQKGLIYFASSNLSNTSKAIELWANDTHAMPYLKNDEILAGIRKFRSNFTEVVSMLSVSLPNAFTEVIHNTLIQRGSCNHI